MNDRLSVGAGVVPPEIRLLLDCLREEPAAPDAGLLVRLSGAAWASLVEEATRLGVAPLLFYRLKTLEPRLRIPAQVEQRLDQIYYSSTARNVRLYHELGGVLRALREEGIPVIVLKGAHLAQIVYPAIGLRPMGDVDLLVRQHDLARVEACLLAMSCTPDASSGREESGTFNEELCSHTCYHTEGQGLLIEVHWDIRLLQSPFTLEVDDLWERARPATVADVPVAVLSPEDLMLHLCLHAAFRHTFELGLRPLCDLSEVIRHYGDELDWPIVLERARRWGAGRCVYVTLYHAQKLLGAAVSGDVLCGRAAEGGDTRFVAWAERQILGVTEPVAGPLSDGWGRLWAADRFWKKVAVFFETCFPPPRFLAAKYALPAGTRRVYLYYPIFLKDLVRRHAARAWRLWHRDEETSAWAEHEAQRAQVKAWLVHRVGKS